MNDKDKEAFEKWWDNLYSNQMEWRDWQGCDIVFNGKEDMRCGWQAACEYKDSEHNNAKNFSYTEMLLAKLTIENAKLRECVQFYADEANQIAPIYKHDGRNRPGADFTAPYRMDEGKRARQVLKELEEK